MLKQQRMMTKNETMHLCMAEFRDEGLSAPCELVCSRPCTSGSDWQSFLSIVIACKVGRDLLDHRSQPRINIQVSGKPRLFELLPLPGEF